MAPRCESASARARGKCPMEPKTKTQSAHVRKGRRRGLIWICLDHPLSMSDIVPTSVSGKLLLDVILFTRGDPH